MIEEWRHIIDYPNYEVSNTGKVKSLKRNIILKPFPDSWGYPTVTLRNNGMRRDPKVHILVAESFMPSKPEGIQIDHIDRNKQNNCVNNLRYCTQSENRYNLNPQNRLNKSSIFKGVSWHKASNKWISKIRKNKKDYHLGIFNSELEAALAYDKTAYKIDPIHCKLNFSIEALVHENSLSWPRRS
jgi:hypothetical protein